MSLINDALKQAVATQPKGSSAPGPALRPVEAPQRNESGSSFLLTALIVIALLLSAIMLWQWFRSGNGELKARARSFDSAAAPVVAPQPAQPSVATPPPPEPAPVAVAAVNPAETNTAVTEPATTNTVAAVEPAKPAPIVYKLQGIVYLPKHSSAVINGRTVYAGDKLPGARVLSITKDSATIVTTGGETNVLELF